MVTPRFCVGCPSAIRLGTHPQGCQRSLHFGLYLDVLLRKSIPCRDDRNPTGCHQEDGDRFGSFAFSSSVAPLRYKATQQNKKQGNQVKEPKPLETGKKLQKGNSFLKIRRLVNQRAVSGSIGCPEETTKKIRNILETIK